MRFDPGRVVPDPALSLREGAIAAWGTPDGRFYARTLEAPYRLPAGPDVIALAGSAASIDASTPLTITATFSGANPSGPGVMRRVR